MAKSFCLKATRLESANRQTLEELLRREAVSEQQREEKPNRVSNFSHKALVQAIAATKGMPSIANALRTISAIPLACAAL